MRYAVVENGTVVNVILADEGFTIEGTTLVPSDTAGPGWTYDGEFHPPVVVASVPQSVTPLQARRALRGAGLLDAVNQAIAASSDEVQETWEYAIAVQRDNAIIAQMAADFGLTSEQVDDLFRTAATL